jgi:hypothetical protein
LRIGAALWHPFKTREVQLQIAFGQLRAGFRHCFVTLKMTDLIDRLGQQTKIMCSG